MTESAAWVLVVLAALLVGAVVPVLIQLRKTLKAAEDTLHSTDRNLKQALDQLGATLERVNRAMDGFEHGLGKVASLLGVLGGVGSALGQVKSSLGLVTSVGSAVGAAVLAAIGLRSRRAGEDRDRVEPEEKAP